MLDELFQSLDLHNGRLLRPSVVPTDQMSADDWRAAGEWLILAERMDAERVFFVEDNPVIVFAEIPDGMPAEALLRTYRRAWSMARPRCLFVASDDEVRVYSLSAPPVDSVGRVDELTPLQIVSRTADVAERLADYRRERVEDGSLFEQPEFRGSAHGADSQFLRDVEAATGILSSQGLPQRIAHGLIERVVLIRYLEDREVLTSAYFEQFAMETSWLELIRSDGDFTIGPRSPFLACLDNIDLTRAIFRDLSERFNGDLFVISTDEEGRTTSEHLSSLKRLFSGAGFDNTQDSLFLWAYDFNVVPTSLISSMYEQFYHADSDDDSGTYYTPSELVEYVLARTLTSEVLSSSPRVCDTACGSGIFLVEAFRRIVRHEMVSRSESFTPEFLKSLLIGRVAGVDTNAEAVRLAAFSLYLAYLNYLSPRDIMSAGPLPRLISHENVDGEATVLVISDAFNETTTEAAGKLSNLDAIPWSNESFDVVVGNPPWTEPKLPHNRSLADKWARDRGLAVGDRSLSQLFLWRALSLLREGGTASLLVAATTFHNIRSKRFRQQWLQRVTLQSIVNFTPARRLFFNNAVAPFALVQFRSKLQSAEPDEGGRFEYLTLVPSNALASSGSLSYARSERKWVEQSSLLRKDYLWKTYFWGSHRDAALMSRLDAELRLRDVLPEEGPSPAYGYQWGDKRKPSKSLAALPSLKQMESWGPIREDWIETVHRLVKREPDERLYFGPRILVSRGVRTRFGPRVRYINEPLAFRHTFYCVPTTGLGEEVSKALSGLLISSLGRYRIFMTSPSWGLWHDSVAPDDVLNLPVRVSNEHRDVIAQIAEVVDQLLNYDVLDIGLFAEIGTTVDELLHQLDELVYELFELTPAERALVQDFHRYTLDLATNQEKSNAIRPVASASLAPQEGSSRTVLASNAYRDINDYLDMFLSIWDQQLLPDGEFAWKLVAPPQSPIMAAIFETKERGKLSNVGLETWNETLRRLAASLTGSVTSAIRTEGVVRAVSDTSIVIVKRNEVRLWSSSAAVDDAEATMLQAMALEN